MAFLPQHLATVAQIGNDVLAELLYAAALLVLVGWLTRPEASNGHATKRRLSSNVGLGLLLGLILITKTTAYIALPLAAGVLIWRWWREKAGVRRILVEGLAVAVPAALIALPWYARDIAVYGWPDFLGLTRHDQIVVGQLRAADFVAQQGWRAYWLRAVRDTFRSFWASSAGWASCSTPRLLRTGVVERGFAWRLDLTRCRVRASPRAARYYLSRQLRPPHPAGLPLVQHAIPPASGALSLHGSDPHRHLLLSGLGRRAQAGRGPHLGSERSRLRFRTGGLGHPDWQRAAEMATGVHGSVCCRAADP